MCDARTERIQTTVSVYSAAAWASHQAACAINVELWLVNYATKNNKNKFPAVIMIRQDTKTQRLTIIITTDY